MNIVNARTVYIGSTIAKRITRRRLAIVASNLTPQILKRRK
jgi:hypothetical protein